MSTPLCAICWFLAWQSYNTSRHLVSEDLTHTGGHCKPPGQFSVDCLALLAKQLIKINSNGWWGMACPLQRQTKWKAQSHNGIRFRTEQLQMRKTGLAAKKWQFTSSLAELWLTRHSHIPSSHHHEQPLLNMFHFCSFLLLSRPQKNKSV